MHLLKPISIGLPSTGKRLRASKDLMEIVEAEVVFLFGKISGHWPKHQTEIHFHHSIDPHRTAAHYIVSHYR